MAEAPRAEVHADPHATVVVLHQVHIVVARADGAQLRLSHAGQLALRRKPRGADLLQHLVIDPLARRHAHAERDPPGDFPHDQLDATQGLQVGTGRPGPDGLIAAADVVAHTGRRDVALVRDGAADRLAVPRVMIGA